jgi:hypothetical protein
MIAPIRIVSAALIGLSFRVSVHAADIDPYLPNDTEAVVTINVRQILDAPFLKKEAPGALEKALEENGVVLTHLKELDLDPSKDIDSIVLANSRGDPDRSLLVVHGRFEVAKFEAKAEELAKAQPKLWSLTNVPDGAGGQYKVFKSAKGLDFSSVRPGLKNKPAYVALLDKRVLVAAQEKDLVIDALDKAKGRKKTALESKELARLLEKANGKQSVWVAMLPSVLGRILSLDEDSQFKEELDKIEAISGGITIEDEVKLEFALAVKDPAVARELSTTINDGVNILLTIVALNSRDNKQWESALDALKTIKATTKGNAIILKGAVTAEMFEKATKKPAK